MSQVSATPALGGRGRDPSSAIYPLLIAGTPARVGTSYAAPAIGFQVAAAYLGTATIPGTAGLLARWSGLEVIGPFLVAAALALLLLHELAVRHTRAASNPARWLLLA